MEGEQNGRKSGGRQDVADLVAAINSVWPPWSVNPSTEQRDLENPTLPWWINTVWPVSSTHGMKTVEHLSRAGIGDPFLFTVLFNYSEQEDIQKLSSAFKLKVESSYCSGRMQPDRETSGCITLGSFQGTNEHGPANHAWLICPDFAHIPFLLGHSPGWETQDIHCSSQVMLWVSERSFARRSSESCLFRGALELMCPHGCLTNDHFAPRKKRRSNCFNDRDNVGKEELMKQEKGNNAIREKHSQTCVGLFGLY